MSWTRACGQLAQGFEQNRLIELAIIAPAAPYQVMLTINQTENYKKHPPHYYSHSAPAPTIWN
jgi:hypothetical protein